MTMRKNLLFVFCAILVVKLTIAQTTTFNFTGSLQTFTVPCGVNSLFLQAWGAQGGSGALGGNNVSGGAGGLGGYSEGFLAVTPGDVLNVFVGGQGATPAGGFNGGGNGGSQNAGGGGGASDVRVGGTAEANRVITAGGGGGGGRGGCDEGSGTGGGGGNGGVGGGGVGVNGANSATSGGVAGGGFGGNATNVQGAGGAAGVGCSGFLGAVGGTVLTGTGGTGGAGQTCCCSSSNSIPGGGGGGGGQVGGGGGGGGSAGTTGCSGNSKGAGGGGGGGSSFTGGVTSGVTNNGIWLGNGQVTISWTEPTVSEPTFTSSPASICQGSSGTVYTVANQSFATSFNWLASGGLSIVSGNGTNSITVTGATGGTLKVVAINSTCGLVSDTAVLNVTIASLPNVTASALSSSVCVGQGITLLANGASTYVWSNGATNGVPFPAVSTGTYTVTGTSVDNCSSSASVSVNVNNNPSVTASVNNSAVCLGQSITLTGGGASTYSWSGGAQNGVAFPPSASGSYTVTGTDGNNCSASATVSVTVNPLPNTTANASSSAICQGQSVTLNGGGASTYNWSGGVSNGAPFTPTNTATYTVTGTNTFNCSATAAVSVTVNSLPTVTATASSNSVCTGNTVTLTGGGASTYTWSGGVTDGVSFIPASTQSYTVSGIDANGCSGSASVNVNVGSTLVITANASPAATLCAGGTVTLTGSGANANYAWSGGVSNNVSFNPNTSGSYTVTATDANSCTGTATISLVVNSLPSVTAAVTPNDTVCQGSTVTLTGSGASTYTWSNGVANASSFVLNSSDEYNVTGTDANGCTATASIDLTAVICTGIDEFGSNYDIVVMPNPFTSSVSVLNLDQVNAKRLRVFDAVGRMVIDRKVANENSVTFNTEMWSSGVYIVEIKCLGKSIQRTIIK